MTDVYEADPLFAGLTRPSMVMGVTLDAFIVGFMVTAITFVQTGNLLVLLIYIPVHIICMVICLNDPYTFQLFFLWAKTKGSATTRRYWRASSNTPLKQTRKTKRIPDVRV